MKNRLDSALNAVHTMLVIDFRRSLIIQYDLACSRSKSNLNYARLVKYRLNEYINCPMLFDILPLLINQTM